MQRKKRDLSSLRPNSASGSEPTSVQSASTASDALPPVGVLFKAAPTSQIPRALAAIMFADSCDNGVNKCHKEKGQKGEKSDKGKGK